MLGLFVKDANLKIELLVSEQFCLSAGETDLPKLRHLFSYRYTLKPAAYKSRT